MVLLEQFPEVPEGLEGEVSKLYESTVHDGFSAYFKSNAGRFGLNEKAAGEMDMLVNCMYGSFEMIKAVSKMTRQKAPYSPKKCPEWNAFQLAAANAYNLTGFFSEEIKNRESEVIALGLGLQLELQPMAALINHFLKHPENANETLRKAEQTERGDFNFLKERGINALNKKLKFEAAIYVKMKEQYGVRSVLPV